MVFHQTQCDEKECKMFLAAMLMNQLIVSQDALPVILFHLYQLMMMMIKAKMNFS